MTYDPRPNPSGDTLVSSRNPIRTNFEIIQNRFEDNHTDFGSGTGRHKFIEMPEQATIPAGLVGSEGTLYTKAAPSATVNRSQIFYTNSTSGNEYQLTRVDNAQFPLFGTNTAYLADHEGGWTFLPGGLFLMYGKRTYSGTAPITITFPFPFSTAVFSVQAEERNVTTVTTSNFLISFSGTAVAATTWWVAIGK